MNIEFRYRFEAAHRFLNSDSIACMTPHGHSWHATLGLQYLGKKLNNSQMTVEFSVLKKHWKELIQQTFDHSYMHHYNDPIVEILKNGTASPRLIPFPGDPTTEMISLLMFHKMETIIQQSDFKDLVQVAFIKIDETPTNSITCQRDFYIDEIGSLREVKAWWTSPVAEDRSFAPNQ